MYLDHSVVSKRFNQGNIWDEAQLITESSKVYKYKKLFQRLPVHMHGLHDHGNGPARCYHYQLDYVELDRVPKIFFKLFELYHFVMPY